ncbi:AraC family transcriptional regulator [Algoriphagus sp. AGSA1]|uniref:AraC family transcriptional regulator n=1 Tax=Algoriphagus sp. AGSA1 TaxID=2907213 RepID=UPI001F291816|nr:AraC family transcriptional regulator [Algoriphagus sp. AGSA1]MCE7056601.1 AraC family transcriptional regulator [Algoriphagus sp. AGSA1]
MPKIPLPIFHIPDFESDRLDSSHFYYSGLKNHLAKHQFIQKPHKHDFYIIVVFTQGKGSHTIDFKSFTVEPGSVFFLSPGQVHSWDLSAESDGHILFFSADFYTAIFSRKRLNDYSLFTSSLEFPRLEINGSEAYEILYIFDKAHQETQNPTWASMDLLRNFTDTLLIYFYRHKGKKTSFSHEEKLVYDQFEKFEILVDNYFKKHREASFYAEKMKLSMKQLNGLCKKAVGKTISQLILDRVVLEAKRLLTHADLNISQVAYELEFDDPSYFTRLFKKKTRVTPEQFRRQLESHSA